MQGRGQRPNAAQQDAAMLRVGGLAGRERETYRRSSIRGNQMNLVVPPPRDLPMAWGPFFLTRRCHWDAL